MANNVHMFCLRVLFLPTGSSSVGSRWLSLDKTSKRKSIASADCSWNGVGLPYCVVFLPVDGLASKEVLLELGNISLLHNVPEPEVKPTS